MSSFVLWSVASEGTLLQGQGPKAVFSWNPPASAYTTWVSTTSVIRG